MARPSFDMTSEEGLIGALTDNWGADPDRRPDPQPTYSGTFCAQCGDFRRTKLELLRWSPWWSPTGVAELTAGDGRASVFRLECLQCEHETVLVAAGVTGELSVVPSTWSSVSTPNTPAEVSDSLEQAERARFAGAHSAAITMYRRALEQILVNLGVQGGSLGQRIAEVLRQEDPPAWVKGLDPDDLRLIQRLGNAASHGDTGPDRVELLNRSAVLAVRGLFADLLSLVYEKPKTRSAAREKLREVLDSLGRG
jgi:hypothetical protein